MAEERRNLAVRGRQNPDGTYTPLRRHARTVWIDKNRRAREARRKNYEAGAQNTYAASDVGMRLARESDDHRITKKDIKNRVLSGPEGHRLRTRETDVDTRRKREDARYQRTDQAMHAKFRSQMADVRMSEAENIFNNSSMGHRIDSAKRTVDQTKQTIAAQHDLNWNRAVLADTALGAAEVNLRKTKGNAETEAQKVSNMFEASTAGHQVDRAKREVETIKARIEADHKANWDETSRTDSALRKLRLETTYSTDNAKHQEEQFNTVIANIRAQGSAAPGLSAADAAAAEGILRISREVRIDKMAQESAAVVEGKSFADELTNDPTLVAKAAGIGGEAAERRVFAKAKKQAFEPIMESIKNIDDTIPHELGSNPDELIKAFKDQDTTFDQRIVYAKRMAKTGGPGNMRLREAMDYIDKQHQSGAISDEDLQGYKELILATSDAASSGKDIEFWLTNSRDSSGNIRTLQDLANDAGVWGGVAADAFAGMNMISQMKALRTMARHAPEKFYALRDNMPQTVRARLKSNVVEALEHDPGDPFWSDKSKYNDLADDKHIF